MDKNVVVYSSPTCPFCTQVKDLLTENNIQFEERNVLENEMYQKELIEKTGKSHIPVTFIDETVITGYDEEALKEKLGIK